MITESERPSFNTLPGIFPSMQQSPRQPPRLNTSLTTHYEPLKTPSPLLRGKSWTEKLTSTVQRSGGKKNKIKATPASHLSLSPALLRSSSMSPPPNPKVVTPSTQISHPFRTSSLPRPRSTLFTPKHREMSDSALSMSRSETPPKIVPFGYPKLKNSIKKSFLNESCTLCDEPISNRSTGERIIELECGHLSHQECLIVSFEHSSNMQSYDFYSMFPECTKCKETKMESVKCIPKNEELKDRLISDFLITNGTTTQEPIPQSPSTIVQPTFHVVTPVLSSPSHTPLQNMQAHTLIQQQQISPSYLERSDDFPLADAPINKPKSLPLHNHLGSSRHSFFPSTVAQIQKTQKARGSSIYGSSSIISSVPDEDESIITGSDLTTSGNGNDIPVPILRSYFIQTLLNSFDERLTDWQIDSQYGLLRLVDKLMVSTDEVNYTTSWCFLLESALIIATVIDDDSSIVNNEGEGNLLSTKLTNLQIYKPIENIKVNTVKSSVLKCVISDEHSGELKEIYLTENLDSDSSKVVQKWISALLDYNLKFNENTFTSTLPLPPVIRKLSEENESEGTFASLIGPNKILEVSSVEQSHDSVIIRRGFSLSQNQVGRNNRDTITTVMTTISSILSLKRERPDDVVIVLQIDFKKIKNEDDYTTIYNTLKALTFKFPRLKACIVDAERNTLAIEPVADFIKNKDELRNLKDREIGKTFNIPWLKETLYPSGIRQNIGIVVISNSSMENDKSVLLMDFQPFTCAGRRRPNELKLKVGYLNVDYSEKVNELVEIESWCSLLETLCYSLTLNFDDDGDTYDDGEDDDISNFNSDVESTTTIHIDTPLVEDDLLNTSSVYDEHMKDSISPAGNSCNLTDPEINQDSLSSKSELTPNWASRPTSPEKNQEFDPLLNDIEKAIEEIQQSKGDINTSSSHSNKGTLYSYL